ncbi:hypothetical protein Pmar_PMAR000569 [Perkinsus marinus ATCC 50983]|uniref:Uncharacterized protein n=1 Tax=Perkinsus marinus (strain ATCC 50983 / TXsc) TaxID=423536 RepID=C5LIZ7_PERM5|nr:hypothetical protein Pmar_PMAR000569 [Perkinsus marinus ATCC 50983]EER03332.1 hypothetical protein Pmar_PMAR000569 [Perkinsus marinus ATCC 50983]|eukprot:XP_002771516.1 hypothetical protein Pmar_PMAR000569 [Perkinsus marinus ATCC 50983]
MNRTSKPLCITSAKSSAPLESSNNHIKAHNADQDAADESVEGLNLDKEDDPDKAQEGSSGEFMLVIVPIAPIEELCADRGLNLIFM